ncbi:hypothetical protein B188_22570 [Candidatus Brocadiaceae bacterium B188]|nr:hypothetical protein B188_22570 [Candidatus Brocadiaceae bacterium B188]
MVFNSTDISTMPDANLFGGEGGRKTGIVSLGKSRPGENRTLSGRIHFGYPLGFL